MSGDAQDRNEDLSMDDLARVERRYRELSDEKAPELVNQAVLNRARMAVSERRRPWPWTRSWAHNLATAVVVALAVTVLFQLRDDDPERPPLQPAPAASRADEAAALRETAEPAVSPRTMAAPGSRDTDATAARQRGGAALEEAALAPADAALDAPKEGQRSPEAWIDEILELRDRGELDTAERELAAFRAAYPEYRLPPALLD